MEGEERLLRVFLVPVQLRKLLSYGKIEVLLAAIASLSRQHSIERVPLRLAIVAALNRHA